MTREIINKHLLEDSFYEEVLYKYLKSKKERDEFRQELWLILLSMPDEKIIGYYNNNCLKYIYIGIIDNQIKSSSSPWHKKFRTSSIYIDEVIFKDHKENTLIDNILDFEIEYIEKLNYIEEELLRLESLNPSLIRDITIFKMHYCEGLTYRQIVDKTGIFLTNVHNYIKNIRELLIKNKPDI